MNVRTKFKVGSFTPPPEIIAIEVLGGLANSLSWEEEAVGGRGDTVRKSVGDLP